MRADRFNTDGLNTFDVVRLIDFTWRVRQVLYGTKRDLLHRFAYDLYSMSTTREWKPENLSNLISARLVYAFFSPRPHQYGVNVEKIVRLVGEQ